MLLNFKILDFPNHLCDSLASDSRWMNWMESKNSNIVSDLTVKQFSSAIYVWRFDCDVKLSQMQLYAYKLYI